MAEDTLALYTWVATLCLQRGTVKNIVMRIVLFYHLLYVVVICSLSPMSVNKIAACYLRFVEESSTEEVRCRRFRDLPDRIGVDVDAEVLEEVCRHVSPQIGVRGAVEVEEEHSSGLVLVQT